MPIARSNRISRLAIGAVAFVAGIFLTAFIGRAILQLYWSNRIGATDGQVVAWELVAITIPALGGWAFAHLVLRSAWPRLYAPRAQWMQRAVFAGSLLILLGYAATWAFGVPAVISQLTANDIADYKAAIARGRSAPNDIYPRTKTYVAIPVLPGLVVAYHEMQVAGLWGWGAFVWSVWWPGHTQVIGRTLTWIS